MAGTTNFPTSLDSMGDAAAGNTISEDHVNNLRRAVEAIETKVGVNSSGVDTTIDYKVNNFFVETVRKLYFYENTAPTGWTYESGITDKALAVKGGSTYTTGGATAGSWTISGITSANESAHTHTVTAHNHMWYNFVDSIQDDYTFDSGGGNLSLDTVDGQSKSSGDVAMLLVGDGITGDAPNRDMYTSNTSPETGAGSAHNHTVSQNGTWRVIAAVGIIATFTGA